MTVLSVVLYGCETWSLTLSGKHWVRVLHILVLRKIRWGADRSLARPTSRCRRTELIVSLERGVC